MQNVIFACLPPLALLLPSAAQLPEAAIKPGASLTHDYILPRPIHLLPGIVLYVLQNAHHEMSP